MASGELTRKEIARSKGMINILSDYRSTELCQHLTWRSWQLLQILMLRRKQARLLSRQVRSYHRVPLLRLLVCWQSCCSFSHFFQKVAQVLSFQWPSLTILYGIGLLSFSFLLVVLCSSLLSTYHLNYFPFVYALLLPIWIGMRTKMDFLILCYVPRRVLDT